MLGLLGWALTTSGAKPAVRSQSSATPATPFVTPGGLVLSCCTSVKAVRLFLTWARATGLVEVDALLEQYPVRTGSAARWMGRLDDGSLLSLRPHG